MDKIYVKRTIVGIILNSMHRLHQEAFLQFIAFESPQSLTRDNDMEDVLNILKDYLDFAVIQPAKYILDSVSMLEKFVTDPDRIGLANNETGLYENPQMLVQQARIINQYLPNLEKMALAESENIDDSNFRRLFKHTSIPIRLN
jgi:hypothetical protein